ncbi:hypothetical protein [Nocardia gipuzkoensis]
MSSSEDSAAANISVDRQNLDHPTTNPRGTVRIWSRQVRLPDSESPEPRVLSDAEDKVRPTRENRA